MKTLRIFLASSLTLASYSGHTADYYRHDATGYDPLTSSVQYYVGLATPLVHKYYLGCNASNTLCRYQYYAEGHTYTSSVIVTSQSTLALKLTGVTSTLDNLYYTDFNARYSPGYPPSSATTSVTVGPGVAAEPGSYVAAYTPGTVPSPIYPTWSTSPVYPCLIVSHSPAGSFLTPGRHIGTISCSIQSTHDGYLVIGAVVRPLI